MIKILLLLLFSKTLSSFDCSNNEFYIDLVHDKLQDETKFDDYIATLETSFNKIEACINDKKTLIDACKTNVSNCQEALEPYLYLELVLNKIKYIAIIINEKKDILKAENKPKIQSLIDKTITKIKDLISYQINPIIKADYDNNRSINFIKLKENINTNLESITKLKPSDLSYFNDSIISSIFNSTIKSHEDFLNMSLPKVTDASTKSSVEPGNGVTSNSSDTFSSENNNKAKTPTFNNDMKANTTSNTGASSKDTNTPTNPNIYVNPNDANKNQNTPGANFSGSAMPGFGPSRMQDREEMKKEREKRQMEAFKQKVLGKTTLPNSNLPPRNPRPNQAFKVQATRPGQTPQGSSDFQRPLSRGISDDLAFNQQNNLYKDNSNTFNQESNNMFSNQDPNLQDDFNFSLLNEKARRAAVIDNKSEIGSRHSDLFLTITYVYQRAFTDGRIAESNIEISENIKNP